MSRHTYQARRAFTLVEVLIVVAIIGILMGLALVGVNAARKAIQARAIALEVTAIAQAVEGYKQKYQNYPPDGSSLTAFRAHFQQVFPNMSPQEFIDLASVAKTPDSDGIMDPAEALVFCLGGFSNDPSAPFTGRGGPLLKVGNAYQYNVDRNEGFFQFAQENLSLNSDGSASTDEGSFGTGQTDSIPVYLPKGRTVPLVYFSSSTYVGNNYSGTSISGVKPLKSENVNSGIPWATNKDKHYRFMNDKSFQLISAGLDDDFGMSALSATQYYTFPSGKLIDVNDSDAINNATTSGYQSSSGLPSTVVDNVTNFSDGSLKDSLP